MHRSIFRHLLQKSSIASLETRAVVILKVSDSFGFCTRCSQATPLCAASTRRRFKDSPSAFAGRALHSAAPRTAVHTEIGTLATCASAEETKTKSKEGLTRRILKSQ